MTPKDKMNDNEQPKSFNRIVLPHARGQETGYPAELLRHIMHDLAGIRQGRFMDLGGGWGAHTSIAMHIGFDAVSVDREAASDEVPHVVCNIARDRLPFEDNHFDVIFSKSVIEHFYTFELPHLMAEILRVLKPGGKVVFMTPDWDSNTRNFYKVFSHVTPYTLESLTQCLRMYGFDSVKSTKLIQLPSTWHSPFMAILARFTAVLPLPRSTSKWVRWSKEASLVGVGTKPPIQS